MAKKVWISVPLITACESNDAAVVSFLKGGLKKELEVEVAAFVTKWLVDKDVPFSIDFETSALDRNLVMAALPKRLQKALGVVAPVVAEAGDGVKVEEAAPVEQGVQVDPGAVEQVAEVAEEAAGSTAEGGKDGPSELR